MFFWCSSGVRLMTLGQSEREMQAFDILMAQMTS